MQAVQRGFELGMRGKDPALLAGPAAQAANLMTLHSFI